MKEPTPDVSPNVLAESEGISEGGVGRLAPVSLSPRRLPALAAASEPQSTCARANGKPSPRPHRQLGESQPEQAPPAGSSSSGCLLGPPGSQPAPKAQPESPLPPPALFSLPDPPFSPFLGLETRRSKCPAATVVRREHPPSPGGSR